MQDAAVQDMVSCPCAYKSIQTALSDMDGKGSGTCAGTPLDAEDEVDVCLVAGECMKTAQAGMKDLYGKTECANMKKTILANATQDETACGLRLSKGETPKEQKAASGTTSGKVVLTYSLIVGVACSMGSGWQL